MDFFANLNLYRTMESLSASSPEKLTDLIKQISRPIKIIEIVATDGKYTVFFLTDVPIKKKIKLRKAGK